VRLAVAELTAADETSSDRPASAGEAAHQDSAGPVASTAGVTSAVLTTGTGPAPAAAAALVSDAVGADELDTWLPAERMPTGWAPGIAAQIGSAV
jgi:hypothetical protein